MDPVYITDLSVPWLCRPCGIGLRKTMVDEMLGKDYTSANVFKLDNRE